MWWYISLVRPYSTNNSRKSFDCMLLLGSILLPFARLLLEFIVLPFCDWWTLRPIIFLSGRQHFWALLRWFLCFLRIFGNRLLGLQFQLLARFFNVLLASGLFFLNVFFFESVRNTGLGWLFADFPKKEVDLLRLSLNVEVQSLTWIFSRTVWFQIGVNLGANLVRIFLKSLYLILQCCALPVKKWLELKACPT